MPYVNEETRERLAVDVDLHDRYDELLSTLDMKVPGELNYVITCAAIQYCKSHGLSYNHAINAIVGALECCKLEFYRRVAASYEDKAIERNGDVYPEELVSEAER